MATLEAICSEDYIPTDRPMKIGRYLLGAVLGEGKSSVVRRAVRDDDHRKVAVKVLNKMAGHQGSLITLQFQQEVEALRRTNHKHVIKMYDCIQSQRRFYIVLEMFIGDLLSYHVERRCGLPEYEAQHLTSQLTSALAYLHKAYIVHRDLKPDNVMIDPGKMEVKIIDFGLSATCSSLPQLTRHCGTPAYMAPEILTNMGYGCLVDLWSLGVTVVEILTGSAPHIQEQKKKISYAKLTQRREMFASLPPLSKDCLNFLDGLLQIYPEKRLMAQEAHGHRWLKTKVTTSHSTDQHNGHHQDDSYRSTDQHNGHHQDDSYRSTDQQNGHHQGDNSRNTDQHNRHHQDDSYRDADQHNRHHQDDSYRSTDQHNGHHQDDSYRSTDQLTGQIDNNNHHSAVSSASIAGKPSIGAYYSTSTDSAFRLTSRTRPLS